MDQYLNRLDIWDAALKEQRIDGGEAEYDREKPLMEAMNFLDFHQVRWLLGLPKPAPTP